MDRYSLAEMNWTWGISLIAGTLAIHAIGVVIMAFAGLRVQRWLGRWHLGTGAVILILVFIIGSSAFFWQRCTEWRLQFGRSPICDWER
jgi:hypothetical protein